MVISTLLTRENITEELRSLGNISSKDFLALVDPGDHQNVPKAVKLLQSIAAVKELSKAGLSPAQLKIRGAISLLGTLLDAIVSPFTDVLKTLKKQLESLSLAAHLACALVYQHGVAFISGQLYHDLQAMIKNAFFCVAKQRSLDPQAGFYFCQLGDDCLEGRFGTIRTLIHDRNVDALQLTERMEAAQDIEDILTERPDLDRGHRRLKLEGAEGIDHVNPHSWIGDVVVGNINLHTCWWKGRQAAQKA
ncbi:hypothetical protein M422DRAFT_181602, partial [Sphaerobolus stellatus SS14]